MLALCVGRRNAYTFKNILVVVVHFVCAKSFTCMQTKTIESNAKEPTQ